MPGGNKKSYKLKVPGLSDMYDLCYHQTLMIKINLHRPEVVTPHWMPSYAVFFA